jgi:hypothetical protein
LKNSSACLPAIALVLTGQEGLPALVLTGRQAEALKEQELKRRMNPEDAPARGSASVQATTRLLNSALFVTLTFL